MSTTLDAIAEALEAVVAAGGDRAPGSLGPGDLVAVNAALGVLRRRVDAALVPVAAEIARQSRRELGAEGLARIQGHASPAAMIGATTGTTPAEAHRLMQVGEATAPRATLTGEALPPKHPHVAAAVSAGVLGVHASATIVGMLDRVAPRARTLPGGADAVIEMERVLVERAPGLTSDQLARLIARAEAHLDPDGLEPAEEERRAARSLTIRERAGMLHIDARLDIESGAPVRAVIEGLVTATLHRNRDAARGRGAGSGVGANSESAGFEAGDSSAAADAHARAAEHGVAAGDEPDPGRALSPDDRTVAQIRADVLVDLCRHAMGCTQVPTLPTATVIVRIPLEALQSGEGAAEIDGINQPITVTAARRLAAESRVIPCALGADGAILDWGRARRLFSHSQKLALTERDGGCAWCGAPPHMAVVHHIRWWERDRGRTDLDNGVLLCTTCHIRLHHDGWTITTEGTRARDRVWFTPPGWLDPNRTPRLGARAAFDLAGSWAA